MNSSKISNVFRSIRDLENKIESLQQENEKLKKGYRVLGPWMSAATGDPLACKEFKRDIRLWFECCPNLSP